MLECSHGKHLDTSPWRSGSFPWAQPPLPNAACCGDLLLCLHAPSCLSNQCNCLQSFRYEDLADALLRHFPQSDHAGGECYCGLHLWLSTAWDARLPCLGKHHRLQQYCPHPSQLKTCLFNAYVAYFKWVNTTDCSSIVPTQYCCYALKSTPTEILSFSEFFQSAFTTVKLIYLQVELKKSHEDLKEKHFSLSCTVVSIYVHICIFQYSLPSRKNFNMQ